jgi:general stress protein 26
METSTTSALEHLTELIHGIDVAMLTTQDRTGRLHSRPMLTLRSTAEGALWFFTQGNSHTVDDVQGHHPVNVSYVDSARRRYVSVSGRGRVLKDAARKAELWERRLSEWLPDGFASSSVVLIRVEIEEAEYWDWNNDREITAAVELKTTGGEARNEKILFR